MRSVTRSTRPVSLGVSLALATSLVVAAPTSATAASPSATTESLAAVPALESQDFSTSLSSTELRRIRRASPYDHGTKSYAKWYARQYTKHALGWSPTRHQRVVEVFTRLSRWNYRLSKPSGEVGIPRLTRAEAVAAGVSWRLYTGRQEAQIQAGITHLLAEHGSFTEALQYQRANPPYFSNSLEASALARIREESSLDHTSAAYYKWYAARHMRTKYGWGTRDVRAARVLFANLSRWNPQAQGANGKSGIGMLKDRQVSRNGFDVAAYKANAEVQVQAAARIIKRTHGNPRRALAAWRAAQGPYFSQSLSATELKRIRSSAPEKFGTTAYNQWYAREFMKRKYGWGYSQFSALKPMWYRESNWRHDVCSPGCKYVGIPQTTLATASRLGFSATAYQNNPEVQVQAGLKYINGRYGTPANAWAFWGSNHWY